MKRPFRRKEFDSVQVLVNVTSYCMHLGGREYVRTRFRKHKE